MGILRYRSLFGLIPCLALAFYKPGVRGLPARGMDLSIMSKKGLLVTMC